MAEKKPTLEERVRMAETRSNVAMGLSQALLRAGLKRDPLLKPALIEEIGRLAASFRANGREDEALLLAGLPKAIGLLD